MYIMFQGVANCNGYNKFVPVFFPLVPFPFLFIVSLPWLECKFHERGKCVSFVVCCISGF